MLRMKVKRRENVLDTVDNKKVKNDQLRFIYQNEVNG